MGHAALAANFEFVEKMTGDKDDRLWWRFNNSFSNIEVRSPAELAEIVHKGHSICAAHQHKHIEWVDKDGKPRIHAYRYWQNWLPTSTVVMDFDRDALPIDAMAETELGHKIWMAYTTVSHTPEAPRYRLVFATQRPVLQLSNYRDLAQAIAYRFPNVDKASRNPVQPYAGNRYENFVTLQPGYMLSVDEARDLIADYKAAQAEEEAHRKQRLARTGNEDATEAEIAELLSYIPGTLEYRLWFMVLSATYTACKGDAKQATALCERWSSPCRIQDEIWKRMQHMQYGRTTIAFLYKMARDHGYVSREEDERKKAAIVRDALARRRPWKRN